MANKRQQIVDAIKARFEAMATSGGYSLNYSGKVFVWRRSSFSVEEVTAGALNIIHSNVRPDPPEMLDGATNRWHRRMRVDVEIPAAGSLSIETVVDRETDVEAAVGTDLTWSGLAIDTVWLENDEEKEQDENSIAKGRVSFEVVYSTDQWSED